MIFGEYVTNTSVVATYLRRSDALVLGEVHCAAHVSSSSN